MLLFYTSAQAEDKVSLEKQSRQRQLTTVRAQIATLRDELNTIRGEHQAIREELHATEVKISRYVTSLNQVTRNLARQNREFTRLKKDKTRYQHTMQQQRVMLAKQVKAAYAIGQQEYLKLLLNQENPALMGRMFTYYRYFNQARSERIQRVQKTIEKLQQVSLAVKRKSAQLKVLRKKQREKKAALENTNRARSLMIARLKTEMLNKGEELEHYIQNEQKITRLIQEIKRVMPDLAAEIGQQAAFSQLKGKLYWPTLGQVRKLFGKSRKSRKVKWNGVMIKARSGMNVRAIARGRVAYADWLRGYGLLVILEHGNGYMSLYGHNQSIEKETGDWVEANEVIAEVGNSGGNEQSGLYFEIRHNGKPVNPVTWCKKNRRS